MGVEGDCDEEVTGMTWDMALHLIATLLTAAFLITCADDRRFFDFSKTTSAFLGNVVVSLLVLAVIIFGIAVATSTSSY